MSQQKKASSRKIGRNKVKCQRYRMRRGRWRNKVRRVKRHIRSHPNDAMAVSDLDRIDKNPLAYERHGGALITIHPDDARRAA